MRFRFPMVELAVAIVFAGLLGGCSLPSTTDGQQPYLPDLTGPYLGQTPPGDTAEIFAPGIVNTGLSARDLAMTPDGDEIYFGVQVGEYAYTGIAVTRLVDGRWTKPEIAPFANDPRYMFIEPFITTDGGKFLFSSNRPIPGQAADEESDDIWVMDRVGDGWGEPYNLGAPINTDGGEFFPSVTRDGTLYFTRNDKGSSKNFIFRSRLIDGVYQEPEKLPDPINAGPAQFNAFIAPDESYMILPTIREDSRGSIDYYITFRSENDSWSELINMGDAVNTDSVQEWSAYVSPDGKYLFFMSPHLAPERKIMEPLTWEGMQQIHASPANGSWKIFWIDASFIEQLRP